MLYVGLTALTAFFVGLRIPNVHAHGYVQDVVVDSTHYTGYLPYSDPYYNPVPERIIRAIPGNGEYPLPSLCSLAMS